jgi:hypothetical protein
VRLGLILRMSSTGSIGILKQKITKEVCRVSYEVVSRPGEVFFVSRDKVRSFVKSSFFRLLRAVVRNSSTGQSPPKNQSTPLSVEKEFLTE